MTTQNTDTVDQLRALARARGMRPQPVHIVLDDELRDELRTTTDTITGLELAKIAVESTDADDYDTGDVEQEAAPGFLADTPEPKPDPEQAKAEALASIEQQLTDAKTKRDRLQQQAIDANVVICVNFHRLSPAAYQQLLDDAKTYIDAHPDEDPITPMADRFEARVKAALPELCYHSTTTPDMAHDLGLTWDEVLADVINHAELDEARQHCVNVNRVGAVVDFQPVSSGTATRS